MKKIAIIHDSYLYIGGAEKTLHSLVELYPTADIYIPLLPTRTKIKLRKLSLGEISTSPLSYLPFVCDYSSFLKPLVNIYWYFLDLKKYDLIISSSHSFSAKSVRTNLPSKHISYIHTPPRYLYGIYSETQWINNKYIAFFLKPILDKMRKKDVEDAQKPSLLIANSINTQQRILDLYQRDSLVVYPPVSIPTKIQKKTSEYYVLLSRLVKQKGIDVAIEAFNHLQKKLLIIGAGPEEVNLKKIAGETISFKGFVSEKEKENIFNKARAMINCSIEEDFGIAPVEAMGHGLPIIAYYSGGLKESIVENKTGVFFKKNTAQSLARAVKRFEKMKFEPMVCHRHAKQFSDKRFKKEIKTIVKDYLG